MTIYVNGMPSRHLDLASDTFSIAGWVDNVFGVLEEEASDWHCGGNSGGTLGIDVSSKSCDQEGIGSRKVFKILKSLVTVRGVRGLGA